MSAGSAVRRSGGWGLLFWALASGAGARQPSADVSGVYSSEGSELAILQGDNETLLHYEGSFPQGQSVGTCDCPLALQRKQAPDRWKLKNLEDPEGPPWTLRLEPQQLVLQGGPGCCGAGWPGIDTFTRGGVKAPQACKVKAARAYFHDADVRYSQRKAFVVAGDSVQVYVSALEPEFVPGRFVGKRTTVGLLKREELDCGAQAASEPGAAAPAVDVKPLAGAWLHVQRKGRGYVIEKPCGANTPRFTVLPTGELDLEYGQEGERVKVTGLKPGAAGAYTVELAHEGGTRETLAWTVVDAKRDIVRVQGGEGFFSTGALFVRETKKAGIPVKAEPCDEFE